jgi:hypothetical protein
MKFTIDKLLEIKLEKAQHQIFDKKLVNDVVQSIREAQEKAVDTK